MTVFGEDENVSCLLVPIDEGDQESAFFDAYLQIEKARRKWHPKKFLPNEAGDVIALILCRTKSIRNSVHALTRIPADLIVHRRGQAGEAGAVFYDIKVGSTFLMVYYDI